MTTTYPPINYSQFCGMSAYDIQMGYYRGQGLPPNWSWDECLKACPDMEDPRTNTNSGQDIAPASGSPIPAITTALTLAPNENGNLQLPGSLSVSGGSFLSVVCLGVIENGTLRPIQYHGAIGYTMDGGAEVQSSAYAGIDLPGGSHSLSFRELEGQEGRPVVLNIICRP